MAKKVVKKRIIKKIPSATLKLKEMLLKHATKFKQE